MSIADSILCSTKTFQKQYRKTTKKLRHNFTIKTLQS